MLGAVVWFALRAMPRLSAAERFLVWVGYLMVLPIAPPVTVGWVTFTADASLSRAARVVAPAPDLYWVVAAMIGAWVLVRQVAAWRVWQRAEGEGTIRYSREIASPAACGWGILLPVGAREWPAARLEFVLRHEQAHRQRWDVWVDLVASLMVAVYWVQPLAWVALWEMRRWREWAADDEVVRSGANVFEYAEAIHECAVESSMQPAMAGVGRGRLEERMEHLLNANAPRRQATWLTATIVMVVMAGGLVVMPRVSTAQEKDFDVPPKVVSKVEPRYTDGARERNASGTVVLSVRVDTDGKARDIKVIRALDVDLDQEAMKAVAQWEFEPGRKKGVAVTVRATVEVNFRRD